MIRFSTSSFFEPIVLKKHDHTSKKATVLGTLLYLKDHHLPLRKLELYRYFNVPRQTGSRWIRENEPRRIHNRPDSDSDPRGRPRKLTRENLQDMEDILTDGFQ